MKKQLIVLAVFATLAGSASAAVNTFTTNPTGNSVDWNTSVSGLGGTVNNAMDFEGHGAGPLNGGFYSGLGVTLSTSTPLNVTSGSGPGQGNTFSPPLNPGEGLHAPSEYLAFPTPERTPITFTISFSQAVLGVGLGTIDYFNPTDNDWQNYITLKVYDGPNGTGNLLGTATSERYNFQQNNTYFMGVTSSGNDIMSAVFERTSDFSGDEIGVDNLVFATGTGAVPEPATVIGASALFALAAARVIRKRKA